MDSVPAGAWTVLAALVTAGLTLLGVLATQRRAAKATDVEAEATTAETEIAQDRLKLEHYEGLVDRLDARLKKVEERLEYVETELARERRERESWERRHRSLLQYLRDVLAWAATLLPGQSPPIAPADVAADLA